MRPSGTALELGGARGDDAIWLAKQGWRVTGGDVAEAALRAALASAQDANVSDRTTFERHDLSMTFPPGKFDLVTAMFFHSPVDFGRVHARLGHELIQIRSIQLHKTSWRIWLLMQVIGGTPL